MTSFKKVVFLLLIACESSVLAAIPVLFSHGITDDCSQGARYVQGAKTADCGVQSTETDSRYLFVEKPVLFNYPDAGTGWTKYTKACLSTLGQENEIELLDKNYQQLCTSSSCEDGLVLMGVSRGAAAAANFAALKQPEKVRALILEAPFDNAVNLARNMLKKMPYGESLAPYFLSAAFPWHKQAGGIHPENVVSKISLSMPILLISSKEDATVQSSSVVSLFTTLKKSGHTEVYLLVTERGSHAKVLWGPDGEQYQTITHAFLARYGLPHDATLAERGVSLLDACKG
jgi:alpha-beta hydrolase superfamily lysophospholipase